MEGNNRHCEGTEEGADPQRSPIRQANDPSSPTLPRAYDSLLQCHRISHSGELPGSMEDVSLGPSSFGRAAV